MPAQIVVELPEGRKLLIGGDGGISGLSEVASAGGIAKAGMDKLQGALASLSDLVAAVDASLDRLSRRPDKVDFEFTASLTTDCNLWIVSGEARGEFKVTLSWGKSA